MHQVWQVQVHLLHLLHLVHLCCKLWHPLHLPHLNNVIYSWEGGFPAALFGT